MAVLAVAVVVGGCAPEGADPDEPAVTTTTLGGSTTTTTTLAEIPPLALYLATIERGLEGTSLEGAAFEEPDSLIRTGVLFCSLLDEGLAPTDVLRGWVAALSVDGRQPSEDDLLLGGVVLGAAVRFICPEYTDELEL